ncbi:UNC93-like protein [Habropoda laboriosa]|uniref:UNC93-like protein n=1 Tax=Habropoda laboriosa TaxID=597456 RepID=A0A0L7R2T7_9HYME|nr:UNC93-like protein [Habropoda laboriosa]
MVAAQHDGTRSVGGGDGGGGGGGEETVYTVTVSGVGYRNEGYKDDGTDGIPPEPQKPPQLSSTDDDTQSRKFKLSRGEKWRILKNISTVSVAFMVQFTAFQGTANLQSSINASDGLGTVSLSAIYAALVLSCIFVPTFVIKRLTVKWTLCVSMLCYAPYIGSQFYPKFYTLVPAGVLLGLGAAPMWAAKATYLTQVGGVYAKLTDQPVDAIVVRFFGFFFLAWQTAELWGNLISSLVLSEGEFGSGGGNSTTNWNKIKLCGADFCVLGNGGHETLERPPESEIYEISAIYLTCVVIAVIIVALFVDPLSRRTAFGSDRVIRAGRPVRHLSFRARAGLMFRVLVNGPKQASRRLLLRFIGRTIYPDRHLHFNHTLSMKTGSKIICAFYNSTYRPCFAKNPRTDGQPFSFPLINLFVITHDPASVARVHAYYARVQQYLITRAVATAALPLDTAKFATGLFGSVAESFVHSYFTSVGLGIPPRNILHAMRADVSLHNRQIRSARVLCCRDLCSLVNAGGVYRARYGEKQRRVDSQELSGIQLLSATAYQLKKPYQQLLIPITVWIGMEQAFIGADFTQAYISCALGVHRVGYVMICFGVVNALCSLVFGSLMKFVGRQPLMVLGAIVHVCLVVVLLHWKPNPENPYVFYTVSGLWGVGDAVWQTQVNGLYGTLFRRNKEAAFSNYRLWESAGFVIAYAYSTHLCARMKLYVMLTVLLIGTCGYIVVELLHRRKQKRLKAIADDPKAAQAEANQVEETDDEKDDIDDDIIITHL